MEITSLVWLTLVIHLKSYLVFGQREQDQAPTNSFRRLPNLKPIFDFSHTRSDHPADIDIGLSEWATKNQNKFTVGRGFGGVRHPHARTRDNSRFPNDRGNNFRNSLGQPGGSSIDSVMRDLDNTLNVKIPNLSHNGRPTSRRGFLNVNANELLLSTLNILRDEINSAQSQSSAETNDNLQPGVIDRNINFENIGTQNGNIESQSSSEVNDMLQPQGVLDVNDMTRVENTLQDQNTDNLQSSANIDSNVKVNHPRGIKTNHAGRDNIIEQHIVKDKQTNSRSQSRSEHVRINEQIREPVNSNSREPVNVDSGSVDMSFIPDQSAPGGRIPFIHNLEELLSNIPENGKPHVVITLDNNFGIASIEQTDTIPTTRAPPVNSTTVIPTPTTPTTKPPNNRVQTGSQPNDILSKHPPETKISTANVEDNKRFAIDNNREIIPKDPSSDQLSNPNIPVVNTHLKDNNRWFTPKEPPRTSIENKNEPQNIDRGRAEPTAPTNGPPQKDVFDVNRGPEKTLDSQTNGNERQTSHSGKRTDKTDSIGKAVLADILDHVALLEKEADTGKLTDEMLAEMGRVLALNAIKAIRDRAIRLKKRTDLNPVDIRGPNARFYPDHINQVDINRISNPFDGVDLSDIVGLSDALGNGNHGQPPPVNEIPNADSGGTNRENMAQESNRNIEPQRQDSKFRKPFESQKVKNGKGAINSKIEQSNELRNERTNFKSNFETPQATVDTNRNNDVSKMIFGSDISIPNDKKPQILLKPENDLNRNNDASRMGFGSVLKNEIFEQSRNKLNRLSGESLSGGHFPDFNKDFQASRLNPDAKGQSDIQRIIFGSDAPELFNKQFQNPSTVKPIKERNSNVHFSLFNDMNNINNKNNRMAFRSDSHNPFDNQKIKPLPENAISKTEALEAILSSKAKAIDISKDESLSLSHILTDGLDLSSDNLNIGHPNDIMNISPGPEDIIYDFSSESEFMKFIVRMNGGQPVQSDQIQLASEVANGLTTVPSGLESVILNDQNSQNTDISINTSPVTGGKSTNENPLQDSNSNVIADSQSMNNVRNNVGNGGIQTEVQSNAGSSTLDISQNTPSAGDTNAGPSTLDISQNTPSAGDTNAGPSTLDISQNTPSAGDINQVFTNQNKHPVNENRVSRNIDRFSDSPSHVLFNKIHQPQPPSIIGQKFPQRHGDRSKPEDQRNRAPNQAGPINIIHRIQQSIGQHSIQKTPSNSVGPEVNNLLPRNTESNRLDNKGQDSSTQRQDPKSRTNVQKNIQAIRNLFSKKPNPVKSNRPATGNKTTVGNRRTENSLNSRPTKIHKEGNLEIHTYPEFIIEFDHARGLTRRRRIRGPTSRQRSSQSLNEKQPQTQSQADGTKTNHRPLPPNRQPIGGIPIPLNQLPKIELNPPVRNNPARPQPQNIILTPNIQRNSPLDQRKKVPNKDGPKETKVKIDETNNRTPLTDLQMGRFGKSEQTPSDSFARSKPSTSFRFGESRPKVQDLRLSNQHGIQFDHRNRINTSSGSKKITNIDNQQKSTPQPTTTTTPPPPPPPPSTTAVPVPVFNTPIQNRLPSKVMPTESDPFAFLLDPVDTLSLIDTSQRGSVHSSRTSAKDTQPIGGSRDNLPTTTLGPSTTPTIPTTTAHSNIVPPVGNFDIPSLDSFVDTRKNTDVPKNQNPSQKSPSADDKAKDSKKGGTSEKPIWNWIVDELHSVWTTFKK